jgi:tRNA threonylcarbamoyladenosine biosynthesis protein TsaB
MPALPEPTWPVLALDTSTETIAAGLHTGGESFTVLAPGGALASAQLLPRLHGLLAQAGLRLTDLKAIAFGHGPGAFTGLRTACAVAQGLGLGLGRPLLPLDSLLIVAEDARLQGADVDGFEIGVAMDARMNEAYAARYRWQGGRWLTLQAPALISLQALAQAWAGQRAQAVAGTALSAFGSRLALPAGSPRFPHEHDRAAALLRLACRAAAEGAGVDPAQALPLYLRDKVAQTTAERDAARAASLA